jgi:tRNA-dihydrouridine synthase 1
MIHAKMFTEENNETFRNKFFQTCKEERPVFVQFCANDTEILLKAAKMVI